MQITTRPRAASMPVSALHTCSTVMQNITRSRAASMPAGFRYIFSTVQDLTRQYLKQKCLEALPDLYREDELARERYLASYLPPNHNATTTIREDFEADEAPSGEDYSLDPWEGSILIPSKEELQRWDAIELASFLARVTKTGDQDPIVRIIMEDEIQRIWFRVHDPIYVLSEQDHKIFNFFQYSYPNHPLAIEAKRKYATLPATFRYTDHAMCTSIDPPRHWNTRPRAKSLDTNHRYRDESLAMETKFSPCTGPCDCIGGYHIYFHRSYANGQGIVGIMTTSTWEKVFPSLPLEPTTYTSPAIEVREIPGKGRGIVAARSIRRGQPIMTENPIVILDNGAYKAYGRDKRALSRLLDVAVEKLPPATQRLWFQLAQTNRYEAGSYNRLCTNAFGCVAETTNTTKPGYTTIWPLVSFINHDCRPNLSYYTTTMHQFICHAARDIAPGEELTISYLNPFMPQEERQKLIQDEWRFACKCAHCSLPGPSIEQSNLRLLGIEELQGHFIKRANDSAVDPEGRDMEELLSLYREERLLENEGADVYCLAAVHHSRIGKKNLAAKYALLAYEQVRLELGPRSNTLEMLKQLVRDPESHRNWRRVAKTDWRRVTGLGGKLQSLDESHRTRRKRNISADESTEESDRAKMKKRLSADCR